MVRQKHRPPARSIPEFGKSAKPFTSAIKLSDVAGLTKIDVELIDMAFPFTRRVTERVAAFDELLASVTTTVAV